MLTKVFTAGVLPGETKLAELWDIAPAWDLRDLFADCVEFYPP